MILERLYLDSAAIQAARAAQSGRPIPTPMYDWLPVYWLVNLHADGTLESVTPLSDKKNIVERLVPYNYGRSVDIVANLLVDTADYALGVLDKNAAKKHAQFRHLLDASFDTTKNPRVDTVRRFLAAGGISEEEAQRLGIGPKERVEITVEDVSPSDSPDVQAFWDAWNRDRYKEKAKPQGVCLITGAAGFVEAVLPCEIRIGGESAPLISVNDKAGYSYGFDQSLNATVSRDAAEGFTRALNILMRDRATHKRFALDREGDALVYVFWTQSGKGHEVASLALDLGDGQAVYDLLDAAHSGERQHLFNDDVEKFYAVALTGNKTRVVFRDWLTTTVGDARRNLARWFVAQRLNTPPSKGSEFYTIYALAGSMYRRDTSERLLDKIPARILSTLWHCALFGRPVPRDVLAKVVQRCRLEHRVTRARAALLKTALTLHDSTKAITMTGLDDNIEDPAYLCGRLLAVLDNIQYRAHKDAPVKVTVADRFFSAASTHPARTFPIVIRQARKAHIPKVGRKYGLKAKNYVENELQNLLSKLSADETSSETWPEVLPLNKQAIFMLGYYHQRASIMSTVAEAVTRKNQATAVKTTSQEGKETE